MDQIDNHQPPLTPHSDTDIRQFLGNNMSFPYSLNCKRISQRIRMDSKFFSVDAEQYFDEENLHSKPTDEHEQNENESNFVPIVYKKRVRTKFNQEQVKSIEREVTKRKRFSSWTYSKPLSNNIVIQLLILSMILSNN